MHGSFQDKPRWRVDAPRRDAAGAGVPGVGMPGVGVSGVDRPNADSRALIDLPGGRCARVHRIDGGHRLLNRLLALGLAPGVQLRVLRNPRRGPLLVLVNDTRIALGRGEAAKLRLVPESSWESAADDAD